MRALSVLLQREAEVAVDAVTLWFVGKNEGFWGTCPAMGTMEGFGEGMLTPGLQDRASDIAFRCSAGNTVGTKLQWVSRTLGVTKRTSRKSFGACAVLQMHQARKGGRSDVSIYTSMYMYPLMNITRMQ